MIKSIENTVAKLPEAFLPDYINLDDRSIENILQEFAGYARQIPFINENDQQLGYWDEMYTEQVLFLFLDINSLDIESLERKKKEVIASWSVDGESKAMSLLYDVLDILKRIHNKAKRLNTPWIVEEISALIGDSLYANIESLKKELIKSGKKNELENLFSWNEWLFNEKQGNSLESEIEQTKKSVYKYTVNAINDVINCLYVLNRKLSGQKFNKILQSGHHPAHIGLLFGFLKSYEIIQKRFNQIPKRHLDYYFKTILKQEPLDTQPDFTYLFIKLIPTVKFLEINNQTTFVAGQDKNGNNIIFETTQPYNLSSAKITELKTLLYDKSDTILPLKKAEMITGIYMDSINPMQFNNIGVSNENWALCGEPLLNNKSKQLPEIGWAIASNDFLLTSGTRKIKLSFELTNESSILFNSLLSKIVSPEINTQCFSKSEMLYHFFNNAFDLQITSAIGMLKIENYTVTFSEKSKQVIDFQFTLSSKIPGWIPNNENIHRTAFKTNLPLLSIKLKQESVYYPYSLIDLLKIETLKIAVNVRDFQNLILYNKHGIVNPASPFPILGINPLKGNSLFIGAKEWQCKKIISVDLKIKWLDLPNPNFKEYYKNYTSQPTDSCFQISMNDNTSDIPLGPLFTTDKDNRLKHASSFVNNKMNKISDQKKAVQTEDFNPSTVPLSFISIRLDNPEMGFGSEIYPEEMSLYSQKLITNIKKKIISIPPQKPFIPIAESILVNYKSKSQISFVSNAETLQNQPFDLFHIHPFGIEKISDDKKIINNKLIPEYKEEGNLYIGLEDAMPLTELSIFMKLIPSSISLKKDVTTIHYLSGKYWKIIPPENIVENSTNNCQETGVIRLILPSDLLSNHLFLDKEKNWLKISFKSSDLKALGRCVHINTNVITVKRKLENQNTALNILEPLSISGLSNKNNSIQSITQPFHSFNGREAETETNFYSRISNRLGHKNRMVRERDYKRMILEQFSEINWIKVLTPSRSPKIDPGNLILIVMPKIINVNDLSNYYTSKQTLNNIKEYVLKHCAPGLNIEIEIPDYEIVEVRCSLITTANILTSFKKEISEIIKRQIAPWLYHNEIHYKGVSTKFSVGNLITQINQHPYVKEVTACQVIRISKSETGYNYFDSVTDGELIVPSTEKSILIPANNFEINQVFDDVINEKKLSIGTMAIGEDLILRNKNEQEKHSEALTNIDYNIKKEYFISLKI